MQINIKTKGKRITDKDVRALYIILNGLNTGSEKMKKAHLDFFADRLGYKLIPKNEKQIGTNRQLYAAAIANNLFTDGNNRKAKRLVMEFNDQRFEETGWSKSAVQSVIEKHLGT